MAATETHPDPSTPALYLRKAGKVIRRPQLIAQRINWWLQRYRTFKELQASLSLMSSEYSAAKSLPEKVDVILRNPSFTALQKPREITSLLELLQQNPPATVCEIGTASGGTFFLLARVSTSAALLISVDLGVSREHSLIHKRFASAQQRIVSLRRNSRDPATIARVRSLFRRRPLDLLFIDGDHSYEGVKADFDNYSPLVRKGGPIVFHDIVTDYLTRYGTRTLACTGQVPVFWKELKARYRTAEFIADPEQDGFGIGVAYV